MPTWSEFAAAEPDLAQWGRSRFERTRVAFLATVGEDGAPHVSAVTPVVCEERLLLFVQPRSTEAADLVRDGRYAMHSLVEHPSALGGEFRIKGRVLAANDPALRQRASEASCYTPPDDFILFELSVDSALALDGDEAAPRYSHWAAAAAG